MKRILVLLFLASPLFASPNAEDQLIDRLKSLEIKKKKFRLEADQEIEKLLPTINKEAMPRAWLHGLFVALQEPDPATIERMDSLLQDAVARQDRPLLLRIIIWKVGQQKDQGKSNADITKTFASMQPLCPEESEDPWCGRLYDNWSDFDYNSLDKAKALIQSKKALAILEKAQGEDVFFLYDARSTLAKMLDGVNQSAQAIKLARDNFAWYEEHDFHAAATSEATNLTIYLTRDLHKYKRDKISKEKVAFEKEILQWLDKAEQHDAFSGNRARKSINYSRARFLYKVGRFEDAIPVAERARDLNLEAEWLDFAALSEITRALCLTELRRLSEAQKALDAAEKMVPKSYFFEHSAILEARIGLAEAEQKYDKAFALFKEYHTRWREQKAEEEKQGLNRLNAELGLKLEEERNERLSKENELQKQKIREAEVFRIFVVLLSILSASTLGILIFALRQKSQVSKSRSKMQRILDNIDQGLLTFDHTRKVSDDYSKKLPEILGYKEPLVGQDIMGVIFGNSSLSGEEQSMIHEILEATFHEDRLAWDMNAENLCREIRLDSASEKVIELRWIPIFDRQDRLGRMLLSLTDTTAKKVLEQAVGQQKRYLQALPDTLKEMLVGQPQHIARLLENTQSVLEKLKHKNVDGPLLRELHTQKGIARALGLKALSHDLHDLETILHPRTGHSVGHGLTEQLNGTHDRLLEYQAIAEILKSTREKSSAARNNLASTLQPHIPSWLEQMQKGGQELHRINILDGVLHWQSELLHIVEQVCVHGVNNSLDHGFLEAPHPIAQPEIEISVEKRAEFIQLEIRDNGQGLDMERLKLLAEKRGFVPQGSETVADVVFSDGFSLAKTVSLSSGRGIGLSAVKALIEKHGGEVRLLNRIHASGSVLRAIWPFRYNSP